MQRRTRVSVEVNQIVTAILENVRLNGDAALYEYTQKFDKVDLHRYGMAVSAVELETAHQELDGELLAVLREAKENIRRFHEKNLPQSWFCEELDNIVLGQRVVPLERVGVYVPGGRAVYPSSLLMGVVPAQVAGVREIILTTPANPQGEVNRTILAAAWELGITQVFRIGGAQAIAAMAFGTQTVPQVDKIVGPGNIYVATAKKQLFGHCGIDMVAGPSEVIVIADKTANAAYTAADLLAQAEHDPLASSIVITDSPELAQTVQRQVEQQMAQLPRREIIQQSLDNYGGILLMPDMQSCITLSNQLAPEHLGLHVEKPWETLEVIKNAGAIFLGSWSPEAVGDYWAGPNHVLPTNGSARFFSPLRTEDFMKTSSVVHYSREGILKHGEKIITFANSEELTAHANAIKIRMSD
ncbi:MAG TPA: histidinol dehydrogenase [bacterium]|nr:histidinol dehydrogenase [bacterium]HPN45354.1 histidinol dehydrogenase [bacterium]